MRYSKSMIEAVKQVGLYEALDYAIVDGDNKIIGLYKGNMGKKQAELNMKAAEKKVGVIAELYLEKRGSRNVALAKINEIVKSKSNLSLLGREKEVLVVSLHVLSKVYNQNEELSV